MKPRTPENFVLLQDAPEGVYESNKNNFSGPHSSSWLSTGPISAATPARNGAKTQISEVFEVVRTSYGFLEVCGCPHVDFLSFYTEKNILVSRGPLLGARIDDFRGFERSKFSWPVRRKTEMTVPGLQEWSDRSENHINRKSTKFLIDMDTQFFSNSNKHIF